MQTEILYFGDQTGPIGPVLSELLFQHASCMWCTTYVRKAEAALRSFVAHLPALQRQKIPMFHYLHDLVRISEEKSQALHPAITSSLLTITQTIQVVHHFTIRRKDQRNRKIIGLCTGSISAAIFASSQCVEDTLQLSIPALLVAFNVGLTAAKAGDCLNGDEKRVDRWSVAISNVTEVDILSTLDKFHEERRVSSIMRCWVSAIGPNSATVSGSPIILDQFTTWLSAQKSGIPIVQLPICAPYHAAHLHSSQQENFLVGAEIDLTLLHDLHPRVPLFAPSTGLPIQASDAVELLNAVAKECLYFQLRLDKVFKCCIESLKADDATSVLLSTIAPAAPSQSFSSQLSDLFGTSFIQQSGNEDKSRENPRRQTLEGENTPREPLAIVGMSGRFPGAKNIDELWNVLEQGLDMHRIIPEDRFDATTHIDPTGKTKNTSWTPYGCFIDDPGHFDPKFFNMSPREAEQTDPMQRLALVTAYEAMEMAGFVRNRTPSSNSKRVGVFYGQTSDDYREVNASQNIGTYFIPGGIRAFGPGRINYFFKFDGPSYSIDTACSSSFAAIQVACTSLWSGNCDTAIAGGMSVLSSPDLFTGLSRGQFLSRTGSCKTYDNNADGYCRADGVATVILKRLSAATADKDKILGVILGTATNHSSRAVSITHPHAETQAELFRDVLYQSGVRPSDVDYVEMHGTGTQAGDTVEIKSVLNVFASQQASLRRDQPLYVGAVKANLGHGEAASGVTALVKALGIIQKGVIPRNIGIKTILNKEFPDLNAYNVRIPLENTNFPTHAGRPKTILVNNFSAAGGNTSLILQEFHDPKRPDSAIHRSAHVIAVSGHTKAAHKHNCELLLDYITNNPNFSISDLSYTTTARRVHHKFRWAVAGCTLGEIKAKLKGLVSSTDELEIEPTSKVVFTFTGQGSHYTSLGKELFQTSLQFKQDILQFDDIGKQFAFPSILPLIDGTVDNVGQLSTTQVQLGLLCLQVALCRLWKSFGVSPAAVVGHSLGEYAAAQVSGILTMSDAIYLVGTRAHFLETHCSQSTHAMLAIAKSVEEIEQILLDFRGKYELACVNGPQETVLSGTMDSIDAVHDHLSKVNVRSTKLKVPFAYHSSQVDPILDQLEDAAKLVTFRQPTIPVISPYLGRVISSSEKMNESFIRGHARMPVNFMDAMKSAYSQSIIQEDFIWIEVGPHPVCLRMVESSLDLKLRTIPSLRRDQMPWNTLSNGLSILHQSGLDLDWSEYHSAEPTCQLIYLPSYSFENKNYWIPYTGDWCLHKGSSKAEIPTKSTVSASIPKISSSLHRVVTDTEASGKRVVTFESDLSDVELHAVIKGHLVSGSGLCPSSLYADIAITAAKHVISTSKTQIPDVDVNICSMEVSQPCVIAEVPSKELRTLRLYVSFDNLKNMTVIYKTVEPELSVEVLHAKCSIMLGKANIWLSNWSRGKHLILDRIGLLERQDNNGVHKLFKGMAYRLFSSLVSYSEPFQGIEHVFLSSKEREACATISLHESIGSDGFIVNPFWIDSLAHISGFVMNAGEHGDSQNCVYISHGWESMRFGTKLKPGNDYKVYVKMVLIAPKTYGGDVWVLKGSDIIGLIENLRFQQVPRSVLSLVLPPRKSTASSVEQPHNTLRQPAKGHLEVTGERISDGLLSKKRLNKLPPSHTIDVVLELIASDLGLDSS